MGNIYLFDLLWITHYLGINYQLNKTNFISVQRAA